MNDDTSEFDSTSMPDANSASSPPPPPPLVTARVRPIMGSQHASPPKPRTVPAFGEDYKALEEVSVLGAVEALLKRPARLVYEVTRGQRNQAQWALILITALCMLLYGLIMGMFSGGHQLWAVPLKVTVGFFASGAICLPSLYIFACLSGSRLSFPDVRGLMLLTLALTAVLLCGFAPITWIFSQSTSAAGFMGVMHLAFWGAGMYFGIRLLSRAFKFLNDRWSAVIGIWVILFVAVVLQMTSTLRPLVGKFEGFDLQNKKPFIAHWVDSINGY